MKSKPYIVNIKNVSKQDLDIILFDGNFIRLAISEKLQREKIEIVKPKEVNKCPF